MRHPEGDETLVYGRKPVQELLQHRAERILALYKSKGSVLSPAFTASLEASGLTIKEVPKAEFEACIGEVPHQGIAAILNPSVVLSFEKFLILTEAKSEKGALLVLDQISDPQNLGAIFRVAEAAGVEAVLFTKDRSAGISPAVRKTSAGASELLTLVQIGNLQRSLTRLKALGYWVIGTEVHAESQDLFTAEIPEPYALILGSEGSGMRELTAKQCDMVVHLPIAGAIESLNVSQAAAILLYELYRRHHYGFPSQDS